MTNNSNAFKKGNVIFITWSFEGHISVTPTGIHMRGTDFGIVDVGYLRIHDSFMIFDFTCIHYMRHVVISGGKGANLIIEHVLHVLSDDIWNNNTRENVTTTTKM